MSISHFWRKLSKVCLTFYGNALTVTRSANCDAATWAGKTSVPSREKPQPASGVWSALHQKAKTLQPTVQSSSSSLFSVFTTPSFLPPSFVSLISSPLFHPPPYLLQLPKESPVNSEREGERGRQVGSVSSAASRPGRSSVAARLGSGGQVVGGTRQGPTVFRPL